ncbi:hypothetical protein JW979_01830, partial [bacterium]|nr:hypothetical protein [candidate division CSSED10-310 bacterium]
MGVRRGFFIALWLLAIVPFAGAQNAVLNPGFEDWADVNGPPDNWTLYGSGITAIQEAVIVDSGSYSAEVTWTTTDTVNLEQLEVPA